MLPTFTPLPSTLKHNENPHKHMYAQRIHNHNIETQGVMIWCIYQSHTTQAGLWKSLW